ncbi:hypothetical protein MTO96_040273 [Rhipicephalus appendiculatus]
MSARYTGTSYVRNVWCALASPCVDLNEPQHMKPRIKNKNVSPSWNILGEIEPKRRLPSVAGRRQGRDIPFGDGYSCKITANPHPLCV